MTHPGRAVWEGIKWFVIAFFVVALGIAPAGILLGVLLDAHWLAYPCFLLATVVLIGFPMGAIRQEARRQKYLSPDRITLTSRPRMIMLAGYVLCSAYAIAFPIVALYDLVQRRKRKTINAA